MNKIAVLVTSYNRKLKTLRCIENLFRIKKDIDIYLVDDYSTDGTGDAISKQFPKVNLIKGSGNLFWNRGMHLAWEKATQKKYDFFLWLNDDVILYENCFTELLDCSKLASNKAIISGIIESQDKTNILYGGTDKQGNLLEPNGNMQKITNMNGNVVLVPKSVFEVLGNLDATFHHDLGDVDYGLRAQEKGIPVYTTRVSIASGEKNNFCRVRLWNSTLLKRFQTLYSPLGSPPSINFYFRRKHFGFFNAMNYYIYLHIINVIPDWMIKFCFGSKYIVK